MPLTAAEKKQADDTYTTAVSYLRGGIRFAKRNMMYLNPNPPRGSKIRRDPGLEALIRGYAEKVEERTHAPINNDWYLRQNWYIILAAFEINECKLRTQPSTGATMLFPVNDPVGNTYPLVSTLPVSKTTETNEPYPVGRIFGVKTSITNSLRDALVEITRKRKSELQYDEHGLFHSMGKYVIKRNSWNKRRGVVNEPAAELKTIDITGLSDEKIEAKQQFKYCRRLYWGTPVRVDGTNKLPPNVDPVAFVTSDELVHIIRSRLSRFKPTVRKVLESVANHNWSDMYLYPAAVFVQQDGAESEHGKRNYSVNDLRRSLYRTGALDGLAPGYMEFDVPMRIIRLQAFSEDKSWRDVISELKWQTPGGGRLVFQFDARVTHGATWVDAIMLLLDLYCMDKNNDHQKRVYTALRPAAVQGMDVLTLYAYLRWLLRQEVKGNVDVRTNFNGDLPFRFVSGTPPRVRVEREEAKQAAIVAEAHARKHRAAQKALERSERAREERDRHSPSDRSPSVRESPAGGHRWQAVRTKEYENGTRLHFRKRKL